ncbi:MAG: T9SS type A sorting domain-containing protein [Bacteroidota bacterium]
MKAKFYLTLILFLFISTTNLFAQTDEVSKINHTINELSIYPQPSNGVINIKLSETQNQNPIVAVYDLLGNKIAEIESDHTNTAVYTINLEDKKAGYYFLKIQTDDNLYSRRVTIK